MQEIKAIIFEILERSPGRRLGRPVNEFISILIILNIAAVILATENAVWLRYGLYFYWFEVFSITVFTVEYVLRVWTSDLYPAYSRGWKGRLRFILTPLALIDLMAILPFYLPWFLDVDLRLLRALRLFRIGRVFSLGRYSESIALVGRVVRSRKEELSITFALGFTILIISSGLMFTIENRAQPDAFSSIPATMWWAVITMTTVGYGDIYPITPMGRVLGGIIAFLGIGLFALPAGILGSGFVAEVRGRGNDTPDNCPLANGEECPLLKKPPD